MVPGPVLKRAPAASFTDARVAKLGVAFRVCALCASGLVSQHVVYTQTMSSTSYQNGATQCKDGADLVDLALAAKLRVHPVAAAVRSQLGKQWKGAPLTNFRPEKQAEMLNDWRNKRSEAGTTTDVVKEAIERLWNKCHTSQGARMAAGLFGYNSTSKVDAVHRMTDDTKFPYITVEALRELVKFVDCQLPDEGWQDLDWTVEFPDRVTLLPHITAVQPADEGKNDDVEELERMLREAKQRRAAAQSVPTSGEGMTALDEMTKRLQEKEMRIAALEVQLSKSSGKSANSAGNVVEDQLAQLVTVLRQDRESRTSGTTAFACAAEREKKLLAGCLAALEAGKYVNPHLLDPDRLERLRLREQAPLQRTKLGGNLVITHESDDTEEIKSSTDFRSFDRGIHHMFELMLKSTQASCRNRVADRIAWWNRVR
jgi:hypothetical protein